VSEKLLPRKDSSAAVAWIDAGEPASVEGASKAAPGVANGESDESSPVKQFGGPDARSSSRSWIAPIHILAPARFGLRCDRYILHAEIPFWTAACEQFGAG
jgi:hypothetical protein